MNNLKSYDKYKPSGVEWLGDVPEHWEVKKLKYIFDKIQTGTTPPTSNQKYFNGDIYWFNPKDLNNSTLKSSEKTVSNLAIVKKQIKIFPKDSILIVGIGATSGKTSYLTIDSTFNQQITGFYSEKESNKYLFYLLKKMSYTFLKLATYTTLPILNNDFFKNINLLLPPLSEQTKIANFLDRKTAQINQAIAQKEQLIALLKERQQVLIHQAVTQGLPADQREKAGLDPNVEMKDSGVEWIGDVPKHWEVKKLKYCIKINNGGDYKHIQTDKGFPVIGSGGVFAYASNFMYDGEVILLGRKGTIDKPLYFKGKFWAVDTMFYAIILNNNVGKFLYYCSTTIPFKFYSTATALPSMTQKDLNNHKIILPPKEEQIEITNYIETQFQKIQTAISLKQQEIARLKEYKTVLIDAAVTGKVLIEN
jgi:type I restriction enzyme S subunit